MVHRWCRQFLNGQTNVGDEKQGARPSEINKNTMNTVSFLIEEGWCQTMDKIECQGGTVRKFILRE